MIIVACDFSSSDDITTECIAETLPDGSIHIISITEYNTITLNKDEYNYEPKGRMEDRPRNQ